MSNDVRFFVRYSVVILTPLLLLGVVFGEWIPFLGCAIGVGFLLVGLVLAVRVDR